MPIDPILNPDATPTKEDLEDFLGIGRYRRFNAIYDEFIDAGLDAQFYWSDLAKAWLMRFYRGKKPIFNIRWGVDYFYAQLFLDTKQYTKIARHKSTTPDVLKLLQRNSPNQTSHRTLVEANLEMINDQEAFIKLLPGLIRILG